MTTMRTILKALFVDVALCKGEMKTMKNMDNQCTAEGYRKFHNLHNKRFRGHLVLRKCNDGNTECQLECIDDAAYGFGTVKCEIGKYGDYRYIGITPCQEIDCEENGNLGEDCAKCEGNSGKYCYTSTIFGICSSSDGNKCVEGIDCEENENLGGNCANCEGNSGKYCYTSTIFGICSSDGNKCVGESNQVRHASRGHRSVAINGSDEGKCTRQGYGDFYRSYKQKYRHGLRLTSSCKDGSTKCRLRCNDFWGYILGSSSATINCENGIYWFDELPKACKSEYELPDDFDIDA